MGRWVRAPKWRGFGFDAGDGGQLVEHHLLHQDPISDVFGLFLGFLLNFS